MQLTEQELKAALRFYATTEDGEGYDVRKPMMKRLAELGLVNKHPFGRYSVADSLERLKDEHDTGCYREFQIVPSTTPQNLESN